VKNSLEEIGLLYKQSDVEVDKKRRACYIWLCTTALLAIGTGVVFVFNPAAGTWLGSTLPMLGTEITYSTAIGGGSTVVSAAVAGERGYKWHQSNNIKKLVYKIATTLHKIFLFATLLQLWREGRLKNSNQQLIEFATLMGREFNINVLDNWSNLNYVAQFTKQDLDVLVKEMHQLLKKVGVHPEA